MKIKTILIPILCILSLVGCEKEKIVEVYKNHRWNSHPGFQYKNSILLNSLSVDSSFMAISGTNFFNKVGYDNEPFVTFDSIFDDTFVKQMLVDIPAINRKIPITSQLTISYLETAPQAGKVYFLSTTDYGSANSYYTNIFMGEIDSMYTGFSFDRPSWNDIVAINKSGQVLIPYNSVSNGDFQLRLLLVSTQQTGNAVYPTEILDTTIIKIEDNFESRVNFLQSVDDKFFVTSDSKTYVINTNGNIIDTYDDFHLYTIIPATDTLYAFGYDFTERQYQYLHSTDNGMVWNTYSVSESETAYLNFAEINNKTIAFWNSQIWQFTFHENGYTAVELDNDGLDGKIITSVTEYKDIVYATTLSGLYYLNTEDLFKAKIEDN